MATMVINGPYKMDCQTGPAKAIFDIFSFPPIDANEINTLRKKEGKKILRKKGKKRHIGCLIYTLRKKEGKKILTGQLASTEKKII